MAMAKRVCQDHFFWYVNDLTSRVVAESGRACDRMHVGKIILRSFKDAPSDFILQIDAGTGRNITIGEMLQKSVNCATSLRSFGLGVGDCIVIMAPNHIDVCVPFYAGLYLGVMVACCDTTFLVDELRDHFKCSKPKVIFCQDEKTSVIEEALKLENVEAKILAFDKQSYTDFIKNGETKIDDFKANDFDTEETIALLVTTSGSTGAPKIAALGYDFFVSKKCLVSIYEQFPTPTRLSLVLAPLQWISAVMAFFISAITRYTTLTSSSEITISHLLDIINKYKPTFTAMSPTLAIKLAKSTDEENKSNLRHLEALSLGGSAVTAEVIQAFKEVAPNTQILCVYAMTEMGVVMLNHDAEAGEYFQPVGCNEIRLVNVSTENDVTEPNEPGELWLKGPHNFKGYHNNPVATKDAYSADGWFKTGDLFYRDEKFNYYFIDRIKFLLKSKCYHVTPTELEAVIRRHPAVMDVAVTGIPDVELGDQPVAIVVRREGADVTAQEIKDLVLESLSETKQLYGGVYFVDNLPLFPNSKVDRNKLKELAITLDKTSKGK